MITTNFINNTLEVFKNDRLVINQPFRPTTDGSQPSWLNEAEALAWWDTIKEPYLYEPPIVEPPPADSATIEQNPPSN